jgi:hypothetical protein
VENLTFRVEDYLLPAVATIRERYGSFAPDTLPNQAGAKQEGKENVLPEKSSQSKTAAYLSDYLLCKDNRTYRSAITSSG